MKWKKILITAVVIFIITIILYNYDIFTWEILVAIALVVALFILLWCFSLKDGGNSFKERLFTILTLFIGAAAALFGSVIFQNFQDHELIKPLEIGLQYEVTNNQGAIAGGIEAVQPALEQYKTTDPFSIVGTFTFSNDFYNAYLQKLNVLSPPIFTTTISYYEQLENLKELSAASQQVLANYYTGASNSNNVNDDLTALLATLEATNKIGYVLNAELITSIDNNDGYYTQPEGQELLDKTRPEALQYLKSKDVGDMFSLDDAQNDVGGDEQALVIILLQSGAKIIDPLASSSPQFEKIAATPSA